MARFTTMTTLQLLTLVIFMSIFTAALISINIFYMDFRMLPEVHVDKAGTCLKVDNFKNGDAYNCNDIDVVLRRYREIME